jgi:hypothetical protein
MVYVHCKLGVLLLEGLVLPSQSIGKFCKCYAAVLKAHSHKHASPEQKIMSAVLCVLLPKITSMSFVFLPSCRAVTNQLLPLLSG